MNTYQANTGNQRDIPDALKSPRTLEEEADQVRHRIDERLDTLTNRLSPGELLDQALGMLREHGGEFGHNLCAQVTRHPVPFVLTGVGLSWLMLSSKASPYGYDTDYEYRGSDDLGVRSGFDGARRTVHDAAEHLHDAAGGMRERAEHAMDGAAEGARRAKESLHEASGRLHEASGRARYRAREAHEHLRDFFHDQPVLAGSLGMALGAVLAAMLPPTQTEDRLLGGASDKAKATVKTAGGEQYERARDITRQAAQTIREAAQRNTGESAEAAPERSYPSGETASTDTDEAAGHPT